MKILHIIGNGFDMNLGLKTSYKDFYEFYNNIKSDKEHVIKLKKDISRNYKSWSDLELALGQYTRELKSLEEFDEVFDDIREGLVGFLKKEEDRFNIEILKNVDQKSFLDNLVKPDSYLTLADKIRLNSYKSKFTSFNWQVDIVTFNYTSIIENILGDYKALEIQGHPRKGGIGKIRDITHIHGHLEKNMVLGVNDLNQIKNKNFQQEIDIVEAIVKEKCNKAYRHNIDEKFKRMISQAEMICIFGSSIGDTDKIWWEYIGKRLKNGIALLIFTLGEEVISPLASYKNNRTERKMRKHFLDKTKLSEIEKKKIESNVHIILDSKMFSIINDEKNKPT